MYHSLTLNKDIYLKERHVYSPLLCSSPPSQKQLPIPVYICKCHSDNNKKPIKSVLSISLLFIIDLFMLEDSKSFSYHGCVWVVLLCHQSFVVHDVFKCLTWKAAKRQIQKDLALVMYVYGKWERKYLSLTRYIHGC